MTTACQPWCSKWTCDQPDDCGGCYVCGADPTEAAGFVCLDWCSEWTCDQQSCSGCEACTAAAQANRDHGQQLQSGIGTSDGATACQDWCSEWTCKEQHTMCSGCAACQPSPPPPPLRPNAFRHNPFISRGGWYVNPTLRANIERTIRTGGMDARAASTLERMQRIPSAFWIDSKAKIRGHTLDTLEGILRDAATHRPYPKLCVFIFYDLPNRDCNAKASNGEITAAADTDAAAALLEYKHTYVDPFASVLASYREVPVVLVIEPDSLGNVISNRGQNGCTEATVASYKEGVRYAVATLAERAPHAAIYVDAAHGGWMGFEPNAQAFVELMSQMAILDHIRGFSTNVANYQSLGLTSLCPAEAFEHAGEMINGAVQGQAEWCKTHQERDTDASACCSADPCNVLTLGSGGATELSYVQSLQRHFELRTGWKPHFVIDTGRNGAPDSRSTCRSWCNVRHAGAGHVPTMNTPLPDVVDAFFYLKTPGESDGCTRTLPSGAACARFDMDCAGADSIGSAQGEPNAPEAGGWFSYQAVMLAHNADLHWDAVGALDSQYGANWAILDNVPPPAPPPIAAGQGGTSSLAPESASPVLRSPPPAPSMQAAASVPPTLRTQQHTPAWSTRAAAHPGLSPDLAHGLAQHSQAAATSVPSGATGVTGEVPFQTARSSPWLPSTREPLQPGHQQEDSVASDSAGTLGGASQGSATLGAVAPELHSSFARVAVPESGSSPLPVLAIAIALVIAGAFCYGAISRRRRPPGQRRLHTSEPFDVPPPRQPRKGKGKAGASAKSSRHARTLDDAVSAAHLCSGSRLGAEMGEAC